MKALFYIAFICLQSALASENYYNEAGKAHNVDPQLLWAIAYYESKHNPNAIHKNKNGTYDYGIMQINSVHLPRLKKDYGITKDDLFDPKINILVGAEILKMCLDKHTDLVRGVTCYNGCIKNNPYGKKVLAILDEAKKNNGAIDTKQTNRLATLPQNTSTSSLKYAFKGGIGSINAGNHIGGLVITRYRQLN